MEGRGRGDGGGGGGRVGQRWKEVRKDGRNDIPSLDLMLFQCYLGGDQLALCSAVVFRRVS